MSKYFDTKAESLEEKIKQIFGETVAKEGNKFTKALMAARDAGKKFFSVNGKQYETEAYSKVKEIAPAVAGIARAAAAGAGAEIAKKVMNSSKKHKKEDNTNDKSDDGEGMDKVQPKAIKKKFADRKDKDIDNDGDVDSSDKYLHKRRQAISKAIKKEEKSLDEVLEMSDEVFFEHLDTLSDEDLLQLEGILGAIGRGVKAVGKAAVGGVKKVANRLSTAGRADAAQAKLAKMQKRKADQDRLARAKAQMQKMKQREREQKARASMKKEYVEAGGKNRRVAEGDKRLKANQKEESVADIIQNKNYSMREALAKVWETSANNNPFEMFGANTPTSNQGVKTVKRDQSRKPMGPVDTAKRQIKRPISSSKTETGKPVTKVEINPKV